MIEFQATIPILRSFDAAKAREFYLDFLGFELEFEHRHAPDLPLYMGLKRGDMALHLSEHHGDACPGGAVFVRCAGLKVYHDELLAKSYPSMRPGILSQPWGLEMTVIDPFSNKIRFCEPPRD